MKKLEELNGYSIEKIQMKEIAGGAFEALVAADCTLDTVTITRDGGKNDGDDSDWAGDTHC